MNDTFVLARDAFPRSINSVPTVLLTTLAPDARAAVGAIRRARRAGSRPRSIATD